MATLKTILLFTMITWMTYSSAVEMELTSLDELSTVTMCVDPDWLPYERLDEEGNHIGLVAEYIAVLKNKIGITIHVVKTKSWQESQQYYRENKCDIVSALNATKERARYLAFTEPYLSSPAVLVLNENNQSDTFLSDLSGKTLSMVPGYVYESKLRADYPAIKIVHVANMEIALQQVSSGEVTATLAPLFLTFVLTQRMSLDNLKIMGQTAYKDELRVGIQKDNLPLAILLDKAVSSLTSEDHRNVRKSWAAKAINW
ncbi:MAG: transporter substrate-binding domain-containing protein [Piscirickettsiaceae bacterium]|nr:transporter substrate-binding domain-containing protein [Piscirickettsiaceae bacterium]